MEQELAIERPGVISRKHVASLEGDQQRACSHMVSLEGNISRKQIATVMTIS